MKRIIMIILGIETSCDETAAALIEARGGLKQPRFRILSNIISSQVKLHAKFGGVVPHLAAREHEKNLPHVLTLALKSKKKPELLTVTVGPGLIPCLWRGVNFAEAITKELQIPMIGVNHLEGHIYSNWLRVKKIAFPAVCLIVSGGHTELILMSGYGNYKMIGATRDDAAGEAYDKVARLLGLGFPGGPIIDKIASKKRHGTNTKYAFALPRPMIRSKDHDFSFSGLKTATLYLIRDLKKAKTKLPVSTICKEFQQAVVEVLASKTLRAAEDFNAKTIMISGGVSANSALRKTFLYESRRRGIPILFPPLKLTGDNATMIAMAGYFNFLLGKRSRTKKLKANANLKLKTRD